MPRTKSKPTSAIEAFEAEWVAFRKREFNWEPPPPGAITAAGYARIHGITAMAATGELKRLTERGKLETGIFRVSETGDGKTRDTRHWWRPAKK